MCSVVIVEVEDVTVASIQNIWGLIARRTDRRKKFSPKGER